MLIKDAHATIERRTISLAEIKLDSGKADTGVFSGYGAVFGNIDSYGDVIEAGAFKATLAAWKAKGKLPKMLLQHGGWGIGTDDMMPVGQWTNMAEDSRGLKVEGRLFALNTERGQYIYEGLKSGELDSLSIGYQTVNAREEVVDGEVRRFLTELKLWEVSIVTFPANDKATISSVKDYSLDWLRDFEARLRDAGVSHKHAAIACSVLKSMPRRDAGDPNSTPRDEEVPETAAIAAARALAAKFAVACLKF